MTANAPKFAPDPRRRAMTAKVHLAKKELGLTEDDYRAVLLRVAGVASAADCSDAQLAAVIDEFKSKGFRPKPGSKPAPRGRKPADHAVAGKARALWISLHQLGVIADPSEMALEAFARRQLKVERLQWANQALGYKLIEALKAMATRAGWDQALDGVRPEMRVLVLKKRLAEALVAKLKDAGIVPENWDLTRAAWSLLGMTREPAFRAWEVGELDAITRGLGEKLRTATAR